MKVLWTNHRMCCIIGEICSGHRLEVEIMDSTGGWLYRDFIEERLCPEKDRHVGRCFRLCYAHVEINGRFEIHQWGESLTKKEFYETFWGKVYQERKKLTPEQKKTFGIEHDAL